MPDPKEKIPQALKELWFVTLGALSLSAEEVRKAVEQFVKRGSLSHKDARKIVREVSSRVDQNRKQVEKKIESSVSRAMNQLKLPSRGELEGMFKRVTDLGRQVARIGPSRRSSKPGSAPKKTSAKPPRRRKR